MAHTKNTRFKTQSLFCTRECNARYALCAVLWTSNDNQSYTSMHVCLHLHLLITVCQTLYKHSNLFPPIPTHTHTDLLTSQDIPFRLSILQQCYIPMNSHRKLQMTENWSPLTQVQLQVNYSLPEQCIRTIWMTPSTAHFPVHSTAKGSYYSRNYSSITGALPCQLSQICESVPSTAR